MAKMFGIYKPYGVIVQKKWGNEAEQAGNPDFGIYQLRNCVEGKIVVKEKFYIPANPRTEIQQANRSLFASAVSSWQSLPLEQRENYNNRAKSKPYSGYNLYIRDFILSS